jgi:copper chaperone CopZ
MRVEKAINGVEGVNSAVVSIGSARVVYNESKTDNGSIEKAVQDVGYKVV